MTYKLASTIAATATAILLLGACSDDDGPTTLAKGEDIELVGADGLGGQTLNISAEEEDGEVTGELDVTGNVISLGCADTDTEGTVILGGAATAGDGLEEGDLLAVIIREGNPDSVQLYPNDRGAESCTELVESIPDELLADESEYVDLEDGEDIETG